MSLPSGYTRLEYIESTGTQYIDTGVVPDSNTKVECDFLAKTLDCGVFGARIDYDNNAFTLFWSATNAAAIEIGNSFFAIGSKAVVNKRCIVEMSATSFSLDGETLQTYSQTAIAPNVPIYIFWSSGASFSKLTGRIYGFKIYKNATAVRDFIPCKNASGVVGLWDNVSSTFYANAGTGTFTAGPTLIGTHKVLINGTEYDVIGGKCSIDGVGYSIKKGRTLVNGTSFEVLFEKSEPESKLTWVFNQTVTVLEHFEWSVNFTSNGKKYDAISIDLLQGYSRLRYKRSRTSTYILVYQGSWINGEEYRTIIFDKEPTDESLLAWLQANAVPQ